MHGVMSNRWNFNQLYWHNVWKVVLWKKIMQFLVTFKLLKTLHKTSQMYFFLPHQFIIHNVLYDLVSSVLRFTWLDSLPASRLFFCFFFVKTPVVYSHLMNWRDRKVPLWNPGRMVTCTYNTGQGLQGIPVALLVNVVHKIKIPQGCKF